MPEISKFDMRAVIQRVKRAQVTTSDGFKEKISGGILILLAVHQLDEEKNAEKLAGKILSLRIFSDESGKMNLSLAEIGGEIMVVSQFTLYGDCWDGNRPSFTESADKIKAEKLYEKFIKFLETKNKKPKTGKFGAMMDVELINDGPVTLILDC
jgi:D-tyrosyl-tRNA(Tyr) deacylase